MIIGSKKTGGYSIKNILFYFFDIMIKTKNKEEKMERKDLRSYIIPVRVENTNEFGEIEEEYSTTDLIYIENADEYTKHNDDWKQEDVTDYSIMNGGVPELWLRSTASYPYIDTTSYSEVYGDDSSRTEYSIMPCLHFRIPKEIEEFNLSEENDGKNSTRHILNIGEYPKNKVNQDLEKKLEELYHGGVLRNGIKATGRWYSVNVGDTEKLTYLEKHNPEFEYEGNKYVRVVQNAYNDSVEYLDGTKAGENGVVRWVKVEPISFEILNWDNLPKIINPNGRGKDDCFRLRASDGIVSSIPFLQHGSNLDLSKSFWEHSTLRGFLNGTNVIDIYNNFGGDFSKGCSFLDEAFDLSREPIKEYELPEGEVEIADNAFNGCVSLESIKLPTGVNKLGKKAFSGLDFKFLYVNDIDGSIIFSKDKIQNEDYRRVDTFDKIMRTLDDFDYNEILKNAKAYAFDKKTNELMDFSEKLSRSKFKMPYVYVEQLIRNNLARNLIENGEFRFLRSEIPDINDRLLDFSDEEKIDFYKFASALGCFSKEKMLDEKGKEIEVIMGQKATSLLMQFLKTGAIKLGQFKYLVGMMPLGVEPNQDFLKFLSIKGKGGNFENLETLIELNKKYRGLISKVMQDFNTVKSYRESVNETGKPILVSWRECLEKFYLNNKYIRVTDENKDIAKLYARKGIRQEDFDYASELRNRAIKEGTPEHILGESLKEESIIESIERIKRQTAEELQDGRKTIDELYDKQFYYEWLNKRDAVNGIIGIFCSCCASINNSGYGANIAEATIVSPDVQNLVVRNLKGHIIAKGAMYVNRKYGYAVINDFELNRKYKHHERSSETKYEPDDSTGRYDVPEDSKEEEERELIFKAFQRGIQAFIEEYESQNPDNPIRQVNVGKGYNRLKRQVDRFERAIEKLDVPSDYRFWDATENPQYILYKREEEKTIESGDER